MFLCFIFQNIISEVKKYGQNSEIQKSDSIEIPYFDPIRRKKYAWGEIFLSLHDKNLRIA